MGSVPETYNQVIKILIDYVHSIWKLKKAKCICTTILKQRNQERISLFLEIFYFRAFHKLRSNFLATSRISSNFLHSEQFL